MDHRLPPHMRECVPLDAYPWETGRTQECIQIRARLRNAPACAENDAWAADWLLWEVWGTA